MEPAITMITAMMSGAITQARPSRPRYGPRVPTFVPGFNPGGRNRNRFLATRRVSQLPFVRGDLRAHARGAGGSSL